MKIKIGPVGIGSVTDVEKTFEEYKKLGIKCAEIPFTYGVYIKTRETANKVKKAAEKFGIELSIHAQYWINLNSEDFEKIEASKKRILKSCEVGHWLGAKNIVFHAGFYGKKSKEESYENIKNRILEMQEVIKKNKWKVKLCPEVMGKVNVFGSIDEVARLVKDTGCNFCIDFAHVLARYKKHNFEELKKTFSLHKKWHCHFSGIDYTAKGERRHRMAREKEWKIVLDNLPKNKNIKISIQFRPINPLTFDIRMPTISASLQSLKNRRLLFNPPLTSA